MGAITTSQMRYLRASIHCDAGEKVWPASNLTGIHDELLYSRPVRIPKPQAIALHQSLGGPETRPQLDLAPARLSSRAPSRESPILQNRFKISSLAPHHSRSPLFSPPLSSCPSPSSCPSHSLQPTTISFTHLSTATLQLCTEIISHCTKLRGLGILATMLDHSGCGGGVLVEGRGGT